MRQPPDRTIETYLLDWLKSKRNVCFHPLMGFYLDHDVFDRKDVLDCALRLADNDVLEMRWADNRHYFRVRAAA